MFDTKSPTKMYRADVSNEANNNQKFYFGLAETTFKERYNNHERDVKHIKYQYNAELAKYIWNLKNNGISTIFNESLLIKFMKMLIGQCVNCV